MGKFLDETGVSWLIAKIKSVFLTTEDAEAVDVVDVDAVPTSASTNLVTSGGVYSEVHPTIGSSQPQGGMLPNVPYKLGTLSGSVTISFASPTDANIENEYKFCFTADSTAPTITWPSGITWIGNSLTSGAPKVDASEYYECSVIDGKGIFNKF